MDPDPIVEEIRRIRDEIARAHNFDLAAMVATLQRHEAESGRQLVAMPARRVPPTDAVQSSGDA